LREDVLFGKSSGVWFIERGRWWKQGKKKIDEPKTVGRRRDATKTEENCVMFRDRGGGRGGACGGVHHPNPQNPRGDAPTEV